MMSKISSLPSTSVPNLPIQCLETADFVTTHSVLQGKNTVIDFWTTKCVRCPHALDKLNQMAKDAKYRHVRFISICCDQLDGAREIIEKEDDKRWQNISHYFMEQSDKEQAKKALGFHSVPFYVMVNEQGVITQSGGPKKINFDTVPGIILSQEQRENTSSCYFFGAEEEKKEDTEQDLESQDYIDNNNKQIMVGAESVGSQPIFQEERVFEMDADF